jgi:hypothetical protein
MYRVIAASAPPISSKSHCNIADVGADVVVVVVVVGADVVVVVVVVGANVVVVDVVVVDGYTTTAVPPL